jgi:hypothetical protein
MNDILLNNVITNEDLYSQEFKDYIHVLKFQIKFLSTNNMHECIQHLNEMLLITEKNKDLYYIIFSPKHFLYEYLHQRNFEILKRFYLPDAIIYNNIKKQIEYTIQYKTIFNQTKVLSDLRLQSLNEKYDSYFTDIIKINYFNKKSYYDQFIDHNKYPRIIKTNISQEFILENKIKINNYIKTTESMQIINERLVYNIFKNNFLNYNKYIK